MCKKGLIQTGVLWQGDKFQIESMQVSQWLPAYQGPKSYGAEQAERELIQEGRDGLWGRDTHQ